MLSGSLALAQQPDGDPDSLRQQLEHTKPAFYWQYAALAADVYRSQGMVESSFALALASPWLRDEVSESKDPAVRQRLDRLQRDHQERLYGERVREKCAADARADAAGATAEGPVGMRPKDPRCRTTAEDLERARAQQATVEPNLFVMAEPANARDCEFRGDQEPSVPLESAMREFRWSRVPELQRHTSARAWSIFVPDLAIDVWRRPRDPVDGAAVMEYAVVYRGTVGGGGWASNLRGVTSVTPLVWDQYQQSREATRLIVEQIYNLHRISDMVFDRALPTRVLITAVGHSLGAGLARYIYLEVPQITRVVGFDPSPIDGSSMIAIERRAEVMGADRHPPDLDARDDRTAPIFLLYEDGEFISRLAPCHTGPLWGAEGGPAVRCESVNYSRGNMFKQHNMPQLACKLFLAQQGRPVREEPRSCASSLLRSSASSSGSDCPGSAPRPPSSTRWR